MNQLGIGAVPQVVEAVARAAADGCPCTVTPILLTARYGGPSPQQIGLVFATYHATMRLQLEAAGYRVRYTPARANHGHGAVLHVTRVTPAETRAARTEVRRIAGAR